MILNYLPSNVDEWEDYVDNKRAKYNEEKKEIYTKLELDKIKHSNDTEDKKNKELLKVEVLDQSSDINNTSNNKTSKKVMKKKNTMDHPLNITQNSKWKSYFDDLELLEEIEKDVRRTRTHMHFFFMPAKSNLHSVSNHEITELADKKRNDPRSINQEKLLHKSFETNADVMCRILFMYAKKHPEVRYIQGMNEMLAPIFYAFSNDQNPYFYLNLEADSFLCFENLMNEIKDIFIRSKDNTETGIQTRIKNLNGVLKIIDKDLFNHFTEQKVEIQYFAFRWYTLFLTQEFEMPDILRLWDSILSEEDKFEFLNLLCLAIIKIKRPEIIKLDFSGIMLNLQNLDKLDVEKLIKIADNIRNDLYKNY
jgi:hypothetical protein